MRKATGLLRDFCISIFFILFALVARAQQDPIYSQYLFNGLSMNPAFAGNKEAFNLEMMYRDQWAGLDGAPRTFEASADASLDHNNMGLGIQFSKDELGLQSYQRFYVSYAYRLQLNQDSRLSFGLAFGAVQFSVDGSQFDPTSQNDPILNPTTSTVSRPDMKAGMLYASEHVFAGLSFSDLLANFQTNDSHYLLSNQQLHSYLTAGVIYPLNDEIRIKPSFLLREDFRNPGVVDLNCFLLFNNRLWTGVSYREGIRLGSGKALQNDLQNSNAWVLLVQYYCLGSLRIGYSFDYAASRLQNVSSGTHEISLGYTFRRKNTSMLTPRLF